MSDQFQRGMPPNLMINSSNPRRMMDLSNYNPQGEHPDTLQPYLPLQQQPTMQTSNVYGFNSQIATRQDNNTELQIYEDDRNTNDVSAICQNVSAGLHQLQSRNLHLKSKFDQERSTNCMLGIEHKRLSLELRRAHEANSSLRATIDKNRKDSESFHQKLTSARSSNTSLRRKVDELNTNLETASSTLNVERERNSILVSRITQLESTIKFKSCENAELKKKIQEYENINKTKNSELENAKIELQKAQSKIKNLSEENNCLSNKLKQIADEESRRQNFYKSSLIYKLTCGNGDEEVESEVIRKRRRYESDDGERPEKRRNEDILRTSRVGQETYEEEVGVNAQSSTTHARIHSQYAEMPEYTDETQEEGTGELFIAE